mgnify:FL=1
MPAVESWTEAELVAFRDRHHIFHQSGRALNAERDCSVCRLLATTESWRALALGAAVALAQRDA